MDKYEYRAKTEQMLAYAEQKSYQKAMSIADTIDWRKVKNTAMLSTVSEIYENAGELGKARDTLFIAYDKAPSSRKVVYRLGIISLKLGHFDEAADCYEEFVKLAPKDPNQYILRYKILKAQKAPVKEQIEALEDFKHSEYVEKWAYELARLYAEAGMTSECLDECDDLILWFSEGTYVYQAMELKMKYKPLTPLQQEKYDHRNDGIGRKDSSKRKPSFRKSKERPAPNPRIADKVRKDVHVTDSIDLPDLPEPMTRTHASEPEAESQPKTRIRSTSDISTTISGASLSDALKAGVAVASGAVAPESASDDSQMTGKMKIEEILANWEATQRENAKILEKSQEEAEKEKALREKKKEEEEEVLGATKPILSDDIRKLMEQLENGEEPKITDEDAEDFVDDEEDEATESPEDSSKEASDTDEEEPEENDFEEIVDSEEDDESDAVYDEEAEYEDEDDSEYDDDEEYEDEDDSEYDDEEEYEDEDEDDYQIDDELDEDHKEDFDFEKESALDIDDHDSDEDDGDFADLDSFEDEEELDSSDDYLDLEFDEKPAPEPEKETSKSAPTPDIDEVLEIEEPSEDEITERMGKFDTGFVVQGRYDLSATSEIGLKLGLTEEQKQLFSYFVPIRGVSEQLDLCDARIADEHLQTAEFLLGPGNGGAHLGGVARVGPDGKIEAAGVDFFGLTAHGVGGIGVGIVRKGDVIARPGKGQHRRRTDAAATAGDENVICHGKTSIHCPLACRPLGGRCPEGAEPPPRGGQGKRRYFFFRFSRSITKKFCSRACASSSSRPDSMTGWWLNGRANRSVRLPQQPALGSRAP